MKRMLIGLVVALLFAGTAVQAEETGQVSKDALSAMGLSDMKVVSDEQGQEVRGQGAIAFGGSYAFFGGFFGSAGSVIGTWESKPLSCIPSSMDEVPLTWHPTTCLQAAPFRLPAKRQTPSI